MAFNTLHEKAQLNHFGQHYNVHASTPANCLRAATQQRNHKITSVIKRLVKNSADKDQTKTRLNNSNTLFNRVINQKLTATPFDNKNYTKTTAAKKMTKQSINLGQVQLSTSFPFFHPVCQPLLALLYLLLAECLQLCKSQIHRYANQTRRRQLCTRH